MQPPPIRAVFWLRWSAYNAGYGVELNDEETMAKRVEPCMMVGMIYDTWPCAEFSQNDYPPWN